MRFRNSAARCVEVVNRHRRGAAGRSTLVLALALSAVAGTAGAAFATHSGGKGPKQDFVSGTATRTAVLPNGSDTRVKMGVNVRSDPSGQNARGRFFVKRTTDPPVAGRPDLHFSGRVTCLRIIVNQAIVGGVVTKDKLDLPTNQIEGTGFLGAYIDNDQVAGGADDQSNSSPGLAAPGNVCPTSFFLPTAPFQQGNYIVHNASP